MLTLPNELQEYLSTLNPAEFSAANSYLSNIFRVNPWLQRFYRHGLDILAANPCKLKDLEAKSGKKFNPVSKGSNPMSRVKKTSAVKTSAVNNVRVCTHIKVNGLRCGSPALRSEVFCYFHQRMLRGVLTPPSSRLHPLALIEDPEGIQASLMEIMNALVRNTIDPVRAQLLLRALHIAMRNAPRVHFHVSRDQMVREVPHYPAVAVPPKPLDNALEQAGALARRWYTRPVLGPPPPGYVPYEEEYVPDGPDPALPKRPVSAPPMSMTHRHQAGHSG
jgi:hypothetical protein